MSEIPIPNKIETEHARAGFYFEFGSSIQNIDSAVEICLEEIEHLFSEIRLNEDEMYRIDYGLRELLANAVVYGNLELKKPPGETLDVGKRTILIEGLERQHPERVKKSVKVFLSRKNNILIIRIIDQGKGFERTEVLDSAKDEHLYNETGRGILLAENFLGQIKYTKTQAGFEARVEIDIARLQSG